MLGQVPSERADDAASGAGNDARGAFKYQRCAGTLEGDARHVVVEIETLPAVGQSFHIANMADVAPDLGEVGGVVQDIKNGFGRGRDGDGFGHANHGRYTLQKGDGLKPGRLGKRADKGFISPMGIVYPINSAPKASAGAPGLAGDWGAFGIFGFYVRRTLEVRRT